MISSHPILGRRNDTGEDKPRLFLRVRGQGKVLSGEQLQHRMEVEQGEEFLLGRYLEARLVSKSIRVLWDCRDNKLPRAYHRVLML